VPRKLEAVPRKLGAKLRLAREVKRAKKPRLAAKHDGRAGRSARANGSASAGWLYGLALTHLNARCLDALMRRCLRRTLGLAWQTAA
jgi:hypothetical protein